jgi:RHS repeat-associated protein
LDSYGQDPRRIAYAGSEVDGASVDFAGKYKEAQQTLKDRYSDFEVPYNGTDNDDYVNGGGFCCDDAPALRAGTNDNPELYQYYYHSDHLGSTSLITNLDGDIVQHVEYVPFGEVFIEERNNTWNTPYLFNAKELDEETGLYYYGARYYDSRVSVWLGVDPLAETYPGVNTYAYCTNNPIKFIDPEGQEPTAAEAARMAAHVYGDKKNGILIGGWRVSNRDFGLTNKDLNNSSTGLRSLVYERVADGKVTEYTYATAGTEASWKDVGADVKQPLGLSKQYAKAANNAKTISSELGSTELTYVGHSLGGGEAALNALVTDRKAITFNAAGVSDITKFVEGSWKTPFKSESKIDAYIMMTDPLNNIQNNTVLPDVNGNRHYLLPTDASSIYNGHSMDNVLKNFGVNNPAEYVK